MRKAVFLDRDGVVNNAVMKNGKPHPPDSLETLLIESDVLPTLQRLKEKDYLLIVVTNQPDVARKITPKSLVEAINETLLKQLPITAIYTCYHDDKDACVCRKPKPGLLMQAAKEWDIHLGNSIMIGDRWKDIAAGKQAGCKTIWLDKGYDEIFLAEKPDATYSTLNEAMKGFFYK